MVKYAARPRGCRVRVYVDSLAYASHTCRRSGGALKDATSPARAPVAPAARIRIIYNTRGLAARCTINAWRASEATRAYPHGNGVSAAAAAAFAGFGDNCRGGAQARHAPADCRPGLVFNVAVFLPPGRTTHWSAGRLVWWAHSQCTDASRASRCSHCCAHCMRAAARPYCAHRRVHVPVRYSDSTYTRSRARWNAGPICWRTTVHLRYKYRKYRLVSPRLASCIQAHTQKCTTPSLVKK